jgi:hypothetical protein
MPYYKMTDSQFIRFSATDSEKLSNAFVKLNSEGVLALEAPACCISCCWVEVNSIIRKSKRKVPKRKIISTWIFTKKRRGPKTPKTAVFYSEQESESIKDNGNFKHPIYLHWMGNGNKIVKALNNENLQVEWDGSEYSAIKVLPSRGFQFN